MGARLPRGRWRSCGRSASPRCKDQSSRILLVRGRAIAALVGNGTDLLAQAVIGAHQPIEIARGEAQQLAEAEGDDICAARPAIEHRQLADEIAGAEPHRARLDPHFDGAGGDEEHAVATLPLPQNDLARQSKPRPQQPAYLGPLVRINLGKDGDARHQIRAFEAEIEPRTLLRRAAPVAEAAHQIVEYLGGNNRFGAQALILLLFQADGPEGKELRLQGARVTRILQHESVDGLADEIEPRCQRGIDRLARTIAEEPAQLVGIERPQFVDDDARRQLRLEANGDRPRQRPFDAEIALERQVEAKIARETDYLGSGGAIFGDAAGFHRVAELRSPRQQAGEGATRHGARVEMLAVKLLLALDEDADAA